MLHMMERNTDLRNRQSIKAYTDFYPNIPCPPCLLDLNNQILSKCNFCFWAGGIRIVICY